MFHIYKKRAWMKWLRVFNTVVILSLALQPVSPVVLLAQSASDPIEVEESAPEEEEEEESATEEETETAAEDDESSSEPAEEEVPEEDTVEPEVTDTEEGDNEASPQSSKAGEASSENTEAEETSPESLEAEDNPNIPNKPTVEADGEASTEREASPQSSEVGEPIEDATEGGSEEETEEEEDAELAKWLADAKDDGYDIYDVKEGETRAYGDGFSITFTAIDDDVAEAHRVIGVKEVALTDEQREALGALSDTAYDVISPMENGDFEYELTLPTPEDVDGDSVAVAYVENEDDLDDPEKMETVDADDVSVDADKKEAKVKDLDHFTVYYLSNSKAAVEKVTICHATASGSNPYTTNTVNINSIDSCKDVGNGSNGHGDHANDIIPPYQYVDGDATCTYEGKNWDALGQAIWNNKCVIPSGTGVKCGDGVVNQASETCDGEAGVTAGENFCTKSCTLVPIYDGKDACPAGTLEKKVGGYTVGSKDTDGIKVSLAADTDYLFRVSGTFTSSSGGHVSDAGYTTQDSWSTRAAYGLIGTGNDYAAHALLGDMGTGTVGVIDWGEYDSDHEYAKAYSTGNSSVNAQFVIGDRYGDWFDTNWQNQGGMSDNSGSLALDVYECRALPVPVQTGYNENDGDPYSTPRDPNELSCMGDFTLINGVSVHWTEVGVDGETVKYERQYAVGSGPWTGSEIYSDPYTNYRTFGGGSGTPGEYSSRVRAFIDENDNNQVDSGEIVSDWSNTCAITYRVIDTLPKAEPECEDGKEYAKIATEYQGDIWFGDHYAPKNAWFELPTDASTSIGDEGAVLTYDGDDELTVTLLAREDDARQDFIASIEFHGQEVNALVPVTSGQYKLETESNCGSQCHIDGFATAGDRKVDVDFAVDVAHDRGVIELEDAPVLCPIEACTLDFAVNNGADLTAIDLSNGNQAMKDTLAFGSSVADAHPTTGDVYYIERYGNRLAYYDISERENVVVGSTDISGIVDKLAFESTGALYAMTTTGQLYAVNTTNAASTSKGTFEMGEHEDGGDLVFGDGGDLYAIVKGGKVFEIDPETAHADLLGDTNIESTGMTFKSGVFYVTDNANRLYTFGKYSMSAPTLIGGTRAINDLARCPVPVTKNDVEICKHDPTGAALAGWEVALADATPVASDTINVASASGTDTASLPAGKYLVKVDGTYRYGNSAMIADAGYSYRPNNIPSGCDCWFSGFDLPSGSNGLMAQVDGNTVVWGAYTDTHSYFTIVNHAGGVMNLSVYDNYYGDNANNGNFRFAVYPIDEHEIGVTGDDGCVTFDDVAYGNYELGETQETGWAYESGAGAVTVSANDEAFTLVNSQIPGTIEVTKVALDRHGNEIADDTTEFTVRINNEDKIVKDGETVVYDNLLPGVYTVEEVSVPGAYELISIETDEMPETDGTQVILGPNETVSVTVTNHEAPYCGDGVVDDEDRGEQCDGTAGVTAGQNFCTNMCKLVPVYDGNNACPTDKPFEKKLGTYQIGSKDADGESVALSAGVPYLFRVNGTYRYSGAGNVNSQADSAYATTNNWSSVRSDIGIRGTNRGVTSVLADLGRGVGVVDWDDDSAFDADHAYAQQFTPDSNTNARFLISDWYSDWYGSNCHDQSCMGDNDGSAISLDVYECVAPVTVSATKIVCDSEDDLPNWHGGPNITATTATEYVTAHEGCHLVPDWSFEWGNDSVSNPGDDVVGPAGNGWKTFGPTDGSGVAEVDIYDFSENRIKLREVLQDGYLPFSYLANGSTNDDDVTAEFYCGTDVANYDNEEWLNNPTRGETYYCVAWNVELGSIHGQKWYDEDSDGEKDEEENYMDGWTIFLDEDGDKVLDEGETSTETSSDPDHFGWYWFEDLLPGEYSVCEVIKDGWEQTYPGTSYEPACHSVTVPDENPNGYRMMENYVEEPTPTYDFGNNDLGVLSIEKTNNAGGDQKLSGENVRYTITVTASEGRVKGVRLSDLPPEVTTYVGGSWNASSSLGGAHVGNLKLDHVYASPGIWDLGDLQEGETVTLTYDATVNDDVDPGDYPDLAFARGLGRGGIILAEAGTDGNVGDDNYVGTAITVKDVSEPETVDVEVDVEEKEEEVEGEVLGASAELPATGMSTFWITLSAILIGLGVLLLGGGYAMGNGKLSSVKSMAKKLFSLVFAIALGVGTLLGATSTAEAMSASQSANIFVRMEEPEADWNEDSFVLDYVVLDTVAEEEIDVECQVSTDGVSFTTFETDTVAIGGDSGQCTVNSSELSQDDVYTFRVYASTSTDDSTSASYDVAYDTTRPGQPKYIEKDREGDCRNKVELKTADDGQTEYIEIYRDDDTTFDADADHLIKTVSIGPDEKYDFIDHLPSKYCGETVYYAVRAFDDAGNGSKVRAEDAVETIRVTTGGGSSAATAETVTLTPGEEEAGEGEATEEGVEAVEEGEGAEGAIAGEETGPEGEVEGVSTSTRSYTWIFWVLLAIAAGYAAYWRFVVRKSDAQA